MVHKLTLEFVGQLVTHVIQELLSFVNLSCHQFIHGFLFISIEVTFKVKASCIVASQQITVAMDLNQPCTTLSYLNSFL